MVAVPDVGAVRPTIIAHRGRLAGPVRPEEAGDAAGLGGEGDVVDGGEAGVPPGQ